MEKINRNLSVYFNSKLFTGIKHEDILSELEKEINVPFSMFVPLMTPFFIEPFITCPYFDMCVAMN
jgi:hypothetical protein